MRIAQVSPLYESVPPKLYGGTERVVSYLTEELTRQGHEVTLFASADSETKANLISPSETSLRLNNVRDPLVYYTLLLEKLIQMSRDFDIIHYHVDYLHFPFARRSETAHVTTLHGRLDLKEAKPIYQEFRDLPFVSISYSQRKPLRFSNWIGNVYHGLPLDILKFNWQPSDYLAFLGRLSPEKGVAEAIQIAKKAGIKLKVAAKYEPLDQEYYEHLKPLLKDSLVEYVGEINETEKNEFLGQALASLVPIKWPEPFGLVMIESLACGTPVIAFPQGSVPELLVHGETGFIVDTVELAVNSLKKIHQIDRQRCREFFEEKYSVERMTRDYLEIYDKAVRTQWKRKYLSKAKSTFSRVLS